MLQRQGSVLAKYSFLLLGLVSLLGWNGILTSMDYFSDNFPDYNVAFYFPIPVYVATNTCSLLIYFIAKFLPFNYRIYGGQIIMASVYLILPTVTYYTSQHTGFWVCIFLIFVMASAGATLQCSAVAFTGIFPPLYIALYFTGTGVSGLIICFARIICLSTRGNTEEGRAAAILMFFLFSSIMMFVSMIFHFMFMKTDFCDYYLEKVRKRRTTLDEGGGALYEFAARNEMIIVNEDSNMSVSSKLQENLLIANQKTGVTTSADLLYIYRIVRKIYPLPLLMWLIYVQTFLMFPGLALKKNVSFLDKAWSTTLLVLTFNIFDTIGKCLSYFRQFYNLLSTSILITSRFIFFIFYILMAIYSHLPIICSDWFKFFNMAVFSLINGYATSCVMLLTPRRVKRHERETAGFIMSFPLFFGILCGSLFALPLKDL